MFGISITPIPKTHRRAISRMLALVVLSVSFGCAPSHHLSDPFGMRQSPDAPYPSDGYPYRGQSPGGFGGAGGGGFGGAGSSPGGYGGAPGASGIRRVTPRGEDEDLAPSPVETAWKKVKDWFTGGPNEALAREHYAKADTLFLQKDYGGAAEMYAKAAGKFPDSAIEEDAWFMMGECYFFGDRYPKAEDSYGELLGKYENTRHLDTVTVRLFNIAQYWDSLQKHDERFSLNPNLMDRTRPIFDTGGRAEKTLENVWLADPTGPLADDAVMQLANLNFLDGDWGDADMYYTQIRQDFPTSQYLVPAYMLGYRTKLEKYDGAGYDRTSLDEAEVLIETLLAQFSDQLGDDHQRVVQAKEFIRHSKAEREYEMGEFYNRKGEHGAARMYYANAISDYPGTQFAELAQNRMDDILLEPSQPPERFAWFTDLFPNNSSGPQPLQPPGLQGGTDTVIR